LIARGVHARGKPFEDLPHGRVKSPARQFKLSFFRTRRSPDPFEGGLLSEQEPAALAQPAE
jgi:hypothetical protein